MNVFLDANILVSVFNKEYPLFMYSSRILSLADHPDFKLYTSPICLAIAFYFAEKKSGSMLAKKKIELLVSRIEITATDKSHVLKAVRNKSISDLEDGIEYYSAEAAGCNSIVTNDLNDFFFSEIEVLKPQLFLEKYVMK